MSVDFCQAQIALAVNEKKVYSDGVAPQGHFLRGVYRNFYLAIPLVTSRSYGVKSSTGILSGG